MCIGLLLGYDQAVANGMALRIFLVLKLQPAGMG